MEVWNKIIKYVIKTIIYMAGKPLNATGFDCENLNFFAIN